MEGSENDDDEEIDNEMDNSLKTKLEELNQVASILTQVKTFHKIDTPKKIVVA